MQHVIVILPRNVIHDVASETRIWLLIAGNGTGFTQIRQILEAYLQWWLV
jgi:NAD(P)H-flavin reductase